MNRSKQEEKMPYPAPWRKREIGIAWDNKPVYEIVDANGDTVIASVFEDKADRIIEAINTQSVKV
jgi:hypothetical protein